MARAAALRPQRRLRRACRRSSTCRSTVGAGQFVAIVGPNGAGKTTLFKTDLRHRCRRAPAASPSTASDLLAVPPPSAPHLGIAHVPEGRQVFRTLTVLENLEMGALPAARPRRSGRATSSSIFALFPVLAERRDQLAGTLSGGEQQMLAIGRGLASSPQLLMLDEPSMGLAPIIADLIFERIEEIHREPGSRSCSSSSASPRRCSRATMATCSRSGRVVLEGTHDDAARGRAGEAGLSGM